MVHILMLDPETGIQDRHTQPSWDPRFINCKWKTCVLFFCHL